DRGLQNRQANRFELRLRLRADRSEPSRQPGLSPGQETRVGPDKSAGEELSGSRSAHWQTISQRLDAVNVPGRRRREPIEKFRSYFPRIASNSRSTKAGRVSVVTLPELASS